MISIKIRRGALLSLRTAAAYAEFTSDLCFADKIMEHRSLQTKDWSRLFANYRGQWVALADDEVTVLAAAPTAKGALAASASKGASAPILYRVPDTLDTFVGNEVCL